MFAFRADQEQLHCWELAPVLSAAFLVSPQVGAPVLVSAPPQEHQPLSVLPHSSGAVQLLEHPQVLLKDNKIYQTQCGPVQTPLPSCKYYNRTLIAFIFLF